MDLRRRAKLVHVNGPPQHVAQRHDLRPAAPVRVPSHLLAVLLPGQIVLRRGGRHQLPGPQILPALQEQPSVGILRQTVDGRRTQHPRHGIQVRRVAHAHVRAVGGIGQAGGDAVEEAVAVAGHLPDGDGGVMEGLVAAGVRSVPSAYVGLCLPLAGEEGVVTFEESVVVDLAGGSPWRRVERYGALTSHWVGEVVRWLVDRGIALGGEDPAVARCRSGFTNDNNKRQIMEDMDSVVAE